MSPRILVRGELSTWVHAGRIAGALAAIIGVVVGAIVGPPGWIMAGVGTALWVVLESVAWRARRARVWLTLHDDGIEIDDVRGYRPIHDSQVSAVALETKKNLSNGELTSITRKFSIWLEDEPQPLRMENKIKIGRADPLAGLIERLLDRLRGRMREELVRGGTATGEGWHLSRTALTIGRAPADQQLPLSEIVAVEPFDGGMCVWRRGMDAAIAKLPLSGRNVYLLPALVQPFLSQASEARVDKTIEGLGRVLFERRAHRTTVLAAAIAGIAITAIGGGMLASYLLQQNGDEGMFVGGLLLMIAGPLVSLLALWLAFTAFRCHERGVWQRTLLRQKTLRYADVGSFQFSAVRHYHHGAYTGTQLTMRFRPLAADRGRAIRYVTRTKGDDDDLDSLRDSVSRIIAARMAEQLRAGQAVRWTANLEFTPDGIRYRPSGLFRRKEPQLLPLSDYRGYDLKQGMFYLFARGQKKAVANEQAAAENFYPGFFLLLTFCHTETNETDGQLATNGQR